MENIEQVITLNNEELTNIQGGYGLLDFIDDAISLYNTAKNFVGSIGKPQA